MSIFFISDTHFSHKNMIKYENRPFANVEEMDNTMINNWNKAVSKKDEVYILGDFAFCNKFKAIEILNRLNGRKYLIRGNHDKVVKSIEVANCFEFIKDYHMLKYHNTKFVLFHYPIQVWDCKHYGSIHLYGHVHGNVGNHSMEYDIPNSYNVGADVNNFTPIRLEAILEKLKIDSKIR